MLDKFYEGIIKLVVRFSKTIIVITALVVVVVSVFIFNLHFENDVTYWVDKDSELGRMPHYINARFGNSSPLLVAIDFTDVFTYTNLNLLKDFTNALDKLTSVESYLSLANIDDIKPTPEGMEVKKLIQYPVAEDQDFILSLKNYVLAKKNYANKLVSADGRVALVIIKPAVSKKADQVAIQVKDIAGQVFAGKPVNLYYSGGPFLMNSIAGLVISDLIFLVPLVTLLILIILYLSFRTPRGVVLPLVTVLGSAALTMGVMSLSGVALNVVSSAVPVILIAVGSAYGIHVLNSYYENALRFADKETIVRAMLKETGIPVLMAGLTTFVGFISNITSGVSIIKTFGVFTALGVVFACLLSLFFIPAILMQIAVRKQSSSRLLVRQETAGTPEHASGQSAVSMPAGKVVKNVAGFIYKYKVAIIAAFLLSGLGIAAFSIRITSKVDMLGYFDKNSEPQVASRFVNEHFGGFNPLDIYLKADMEDPDILKLSLILQEYLKAYPDVSSPSGLADVISELNQAMVGAYTIPETKAEITNLWFFVEGNEMLESMVTDEKQEALISVFLPSLDNTYLGGLFASMQTVMERYSRDGKGIPVINNSMQNAGVHELETLMLGNLLKEYRIAVNREDTARVAAELARGLARFKPQWDDTRLAPYLAGDEAELVLEPAVSKALLHRLRQQYTRDAALPGRDAIRDILSAVNPGAETDNEEYAENSEALAGSLAQLLGEQADRQKMDFLVASIRNLYPELDKAELSVLNYTFSPLLWKTLPVPPDRLAGNVPVRYAKVEKMELTGTAFLIEQIRKNIFSNQLSSIGLALLAVFLLNWLTFGSLLEGLISLIGIIFTILVNFGIMGIFNIPLDFVTALIGSVAIGTGIDYTIHFITRYTGELRKNNQDVLLAYTNTLASSGKAIIYNALSVGLGFSVLCFSNVIPFRTAGLLLAITMVTSSLAALTFLPAVLMVTKVTQKQVVKEELNDTNPGKTKTAAKILSVDEETLG